MHQWLRTVSLANEDFCVICIALQFAAETYSMSVADTKQLLIIKSVSKCGSRVNYLAHSMPCRSLVYSSAIAGYCCTGGRPGQTSIVIHPRIFHRQVIGSKYTSGRMSQLYTLRSALRNLALPSLPSSLVSPFPFPFSPILNPSFLVHHVASMPGYKLVHFRHDSTDLWYYDGVIVKQSSKILRTK